MVARLKKICFFVRYHRNIQPVKIFIISQYFNKSKNKKRGIGMNMYGFAPMGTTTAMVRCHAGVVVEVKQGAP